MAQAALPQSAAPKKDYDDLESPVMDAFWAVECARNMVEDEMNTIFSQTKNGDEDVTKVYFSRLQAERLVWMMGQAADKMIVLKASYYGKGN